MHYRAGNNHIYCKCDSQVSINIRPYNVGLYAVFLAPQYKMIERISEREELNTLKMLETRCEKAISDTAVNY